MTKNQIILKNSLIAGAVYFLLLSLAHLFEIKVPGLFIYYDVPSYMYQNKIISMLAFGWSAFFYQGGRLVVAGEVGDVRLQIASGIFAIGILVLINLSGELRAVSPVISLLRYWLAVGFLAVYLIWLCIFYYKALKEK